MATHSIVLAWRIPGMGEPGGLLSMGSHRVGHDWNDLAVAVAVFLIGGQLLTMLWLLLYIIMNQPWIYILPLPLEPPSHLPPHPTPLGCHRALGLIWIGTNHFICLGPFFNPSWLLFFKAWWVLSVQPRTQTWVTQRCAIVKNLPSWKCPFENYAKRGHKLKTYGHKVKTSELFNCVYLGQHLHSLLLKKYQNLWAMFIFSFSRQGVQFWRETFEKP